MSKRELYFRNYKTGEIGQRVDVSGQPARQVERCLRGMLINKHDDWIVHDTADDERATPTGPHGERG